MCTSRRCVSWMVSTTKGFFTAQVKRFLFLYFADEKNLLWEWNFQTAGTRFTFLWHFLFSLSASFISSYLIVSLLMSVIISSFYLTSIILSISCCPLFHISSFPPSSPLSFFLTYLLTYLLTHLLSFFLCSCLSFLFTSPQTFYFLSLNFSFPPTVCVLFGPVRLISWI